VSGGGGGKIWSKEVTRRMGLRAGNQVMQEGKLGGRVLNRRRRFFAREGLDLTWEGAEKTEAFAQEQVVKEEN